MTYQQQLASQLSRILEKAEKIKKRNLLFIELEQISFELKNWRHTVLDMTDSYQELSEEQLAIINQLVDSWNEKNKDLRELLQDLL